MRFQEAYEGLSAGRLTQVEATLLLGECERSFRRRTERFDADGLEGLLDKRLSQNSKRRALGGEVDQVVHPYKSGFASWNVAHFQRFCDLGAARAWAANFVHWYNIDHRHSGIQYVSPSQRHEGEDHAILAARHTLYLQAREKNPARWSGDTRNWSPIEAVTLNPERDCVIKAHSGCNDIRRLAA